MGLEQDTGSHSAVKANRQTTKIKINKNLFSVASDRHAQSKGSMSFLP